MKLKPPMSVVWEVLRVHFEMFFRVQDLRWSGKFCIAPPVLGISWLSIWLVGRSLVQLLPPPILNKRYIGFFWLRPLVQGGAEAVWRLPGGELQLRQWSS